MERRVDGTEAEEIILEMDGEGGGGGGTGEAPEGPHFDELKISLVTNTEALDRIQTSQQKMISGGEPHHNIVPIFPSLPSLPFVLTPHRDHFTQKRFPWN